MKWFKKLFRCQCNELKYVEIDKKLNALNEAVEELILKEHQKQVEKNEEKKD